MARKSAHAPLGVYQNGDRVGRLDRQSSGAISFGYDVAWLENDGANPVSLSLPLREERFAGAPVIAVFDNLLPDGNALRRRVAERVGADGDDAFSLLSAIGRDCVGALQFLPDGEAPSTASASDSDPIDDAAVARRLKALAFAPLGMDDNEDFRISIAGAQEKTALLRWRDQWRLTRGATPTTHILKPQIGRLPSGIDMSQSVENEYFCMKLAAALGLRAAKVAIADFEDVRVLAVERFDRRWLSETQPARVPQEDFCQALSVAPTRKYQSEGGPSSNAVLDLLRASDEPDTDRAAFLKAQIFFWLIGATDGHAKNFSVYLGPLGSFRMTPLYDVLSAQPAGDLGQISRNKMKLAMSVGRSKHYVVDWIATRHFYETADASGFAAQSVTKIIEDLKAAGDDALDATMRALPTDFPQPLSESIGAAFRRRLRLLTPQSG
ncbi:MAG: type II toxin-antitoxin system HipA family toxin [Parvularculaceae bacterium]